MMTAVPEAPVVTAEQLEGWFKDAISRRRRPTKVDCAELAEHVNRHLPSLNAMYAAKQWRNDVVEAVRHGRRLASPLQRLQPVGENPLITRPTIDEELLAVLTRWLELHDPWHLKETKTDLWTACAKVFTPHIVETLRKAGWRQQPSTTSDGGPAMAILSLLIGAVTGAEPPDPGSLGRTIREHASLQN